MAQTERAIPGKPEEAREALLALLLDLGGPTDPEGAHLDADRALLEYIGDPEISAAFEAIEKWYA